VFHVKLDSDPEMRRHFDVVVVGGGHAGCEAAAAAARLGAATLLITKDFQDLGALSCNPAIGGLGKGQIVREIDAMGGIMGEVGDLAAIQYRLLNRSRGAAARGPRAQIDRDLYRIHMRRVLEGIPHLSLRESMVLQLTHEKGRIAGVLTTEGRIGAGSVILTAGTFLNGVIHIGSTTIPAGRMGELPSIELADDLRALGLRTGRLKTGTPPRLRASSIDTRNLPVQEADSDPEFFSTRTKRAHNAQICCHITRTTPNTHAEILAEVPNSPLFSGAIRGRGPRYCPSIEDKVTRFGDRDSHQIFLEPEGLQSDVVYPNGISTSLSEESQQRFVRSIPGLEKVEILRPGYAIEYDFYDPNDLLPTLESKRVESLFLAGQVNGTTGYEEAAGQGLVAGINAALRALGRAPVIFPRTNSYIGVMIDDLTSRPVTEPYRMFTSRSEFRLSIRADNADIRLSPLAIELGILPEDLKSSFSRKIAESVALRARLQDLVFSPSEWRELGIAVNADGIRRSAFDILARSEITFGDLAAIFPELATSERQAGYVETEAKYAVYLNRQQDAVEAYQRAMELGIPADLDYQGIAGLSSELKARLSAARPLTLAHADRIEGMTPAAMTILSGHAKRCIVADC
jgi:tRNA uridine 5-carboxymethylaminomethyl modification enzyme